MGRKRQAETDLKQGDSESEASQDEQGAGTWTPASEDEIAQREVVKVSRKRRAAVTSTSSSFPVFNFAEKAAEQTPAKSESEEQPAEESAPASSATSNENPLLKFMPKAGSWNCEVCLVNNDASKAKCAACDAPNPGAKDDKPPSPKKSALNPNAHEFKFGGDSSGTTFKFGVAPGESTTASTTFSFGASVPAFGTSTTTTPFKFGTSEGDQPASFSSLSGNGAGASFSFLSSTETPATTSFQFASKTFEQETPAKEPLSEPVESGEENDQIVLKVPVVAYNLKTVEKEVDGKAEKKQQWQECGNGDLHVNTYQGEDGESRSRLVLRMAKTHRLALNAPLFKDMALERSHDKMVRLTSVSVDDPTQFESYLLKTKSKEEADSLFNTLTQLTV